MIARAEQYCRDVAAGKIPACASVRAACARHAADRKSARLRGYHFDERAARRAIEFFAFLRHSKGEWAGQPFRLSPWQEWIVWSLFGWKGPDGTRRFRVAYLELPRKNGKSTTAAAIALDLLVADQEPGAEIYCAATKLAQARIVHAEAVRMVRASPGLRELVTINKDNLCVESTASKFEPLGGDGSKLDGLNLHGGIIDELHAHRTRDIWDVLETATSSRRQPLLVAITTAGFDRHSVCWELHEYTRRVLEGDLHDDTFFGACWGIDEGDDWRKEASWRKANPNWGVSVKPDDLRRKAKKAAELPSAENAFRRLHCNEWTEQAQRWLPLEKWDACTALLDPEALRGEACYAGLDLASTTDLAALALVFPGGEENKQPWRVVFTFWCPEENARDRARRDRVPYAEWISAGLITATPGNSIDYERIRSDVLELAGQYRIEKLGIDRWNATQLAQQLDGDGLAIELVGQGFASLSAPTKALEALVLSRRIAHGGHRVMRWMVGNAAIEQDAAGNMKPSKKRSSEKIDGVVALVMAVGLAQQGDGGSVYSERGIFTL